MSMLEILRTAFSGGGMPRQSGDSYDEADLMRYRAQLNEHYLQVQHDLASARTADERAQAEAKAQRLAQVAPQLFQGVIGESVGANDVGAPNQHGYIDPRQAGAYQAMAGSMRAMMASGVPELQQAALQSYDQLFGATVPKAPGYNPPQAADPTKMMTDDIKEFEFARQNGFGGSFEQWLTSQVQARRPQTTVSVGGANVQMPPMSFQTQNYENQYDKTVGEQNAKDFITLQQAPGATLGRLQTMNDIHNLLGNTGGFMGKSLQEIKMAANRLGINVEGMDAAQAAGALENTLVMQMRSTADGGGMPGAMSDADRKFLENTVPGLNMTPQGRLQYLEIQKRVLQRQQEVAQAARDYAHQNGGRIDYQFNNQLEQIRKNALFSDLDVARPSPGGGGSTQQRVRVRNEAEAYALPPGTKYLTPDGIPMTR